MGNEISMALNDFQRAKLILKPAIRDGRHGKEKTFILFSNSLFLPALLFGLRVANRMGPGVPVILFLPVSRLARKDLLNLPLSSGRSG